MSRTTSRIISRDHLGDCEAWLPPTMKSTGDQLGVEMEAVVHPMTAAELEAIHREARDEGFAEGRKAGEPQGYQEGLKAGHAEMEARLAILDQLLRQFSKPLEKLDEQVEGALVQLAMSVARHLVRRELKTDPGQVIAVIREAMAALPVASPRVSIYLHPEDAALVRERMSIRDDEQQWQLVEEPTMGRGGCRLVTDVSEVDATVESSVAAAVARILGEERDGELS